MMQELRNIEGDNGYRSVVKQGSASYSTGISWLVFSLSTIASLQLVARDVHGHGLRQYKKYFIADVLIYKRK